MAYQFDVVIIGAGPAGLSAGIVFARNGLRTLVFEERRLPVDKACGEGLMPSGVQALQILDLLPFIPPAGYLPFSGIRYYAPSGESATGFFREGPGWGITRLNLSAALMSRACLESTIEIRDNQRAEIQIGRSSNLQVKAGQETFTSRLVIVADGLNSTLRRKLGLQGQPGKLQRWGTRQHFAISPWSNFVEVHWGRGIEAYITPVSPAQVNVAFLWDKGVLKGIQGRKNLFPSLLSLFPSLQDRLVRAEPLDQSQSAGPFHRSARSPISNGLILIGDAAGYLDALTGEGISLALHQALALEKWVVPLLKANAGGNSPLSIRQLSGYRRAYHSLMKPYYHMTRIALLAAHHTWLAEGAVRLFERIPALFSVLLSVNMGEPLYPRRKSNRSNHSDPNNN